MEKYKNLFTQPTISVGSISTENKINGYELWAFDLKSDKTEPIKADVCLKQVLTQKPCSCELHILKIIQNEHSGNRKSAEC